jgi:hypothetical protein
MQDVFSGDNMIIENYFFEDLWYDVGSLMIAKLVLLQKKRH